MTTAILEPGRPSFQWDAAAGDLIVRASAGGECVRRAHYELSGANPTDPPIGSNPLHLRAGRDLEPLVFQALRNQGWRTSHYANRVSSKRPAFALTPVAGVVYTGSPDGRVRWTGEGHNPWMLAECKTRGAQAWTHTQRAGNRRAHPEAITQLAIYQAGMAAVHPDEIDAQAPAVIATLNTDTKKLHVELHEADRLTDHLTQVVIPRHQKLRSTLLGEAGIPEPELPQNHWKCQRCPFRTRCGNVATAPEPPEADLSLLDEKLTRHWQAAHEAETRNRDHRNSEKERRARQDEIVDMMLELGYAERFFAVNGQQVRAELSTSESLRVPAAKIGLLSQWLTPEQFDRVTETGVTRRLALKAERS